MRSASGEPKKGREKGMRFADRGEAGRRLGRAVARLDLADPVVLGIPRGGVAVAAEVARTLLAPLDVAGAAKLGAPFNRELALAAVAPGGVLVMNEELARHLGVTAADLAAEAARKERDLTARLARFRGGRPPVPLGGRTAVLVDDGLATGLTVAAAIESLRRRDPARVVLAVPVASREAARALAPRVDDLVCLLVPPDFRSVGESYLDFSQVSDSDVMALLRAAARPADGPPR